MGGTQLLQIQYHNLFKMPKPIDINSAVSVQLYVN